MPDHDEVNDPEWLLEWSLSQLPAQKGRGGHYFGPMFRLKDTDVFCNDDSTHTITAWGGCLDSPAISSSQALSDITAVQVYDEAGNFLHYEYVNLDANENKGEREAA